MNHTPSRDTQLHLHIPWSGKQVVWGIFGLLGILFFWLSVRGIHGSSIGEFFPYFGSGGQDPYLLYGRSRRVRSDEWLVTTPYVLGQSQLEPTFSLINGNVGGGQNMFSSFVPVRHWSTLFKPFDWPYFIFPFATAYAMHWWFRGILLLIGAYVLFEVLTKRNRWLSLGGALFLLFSPYLHWWYSTTVIELSAYVFWLLYFVVVFFRETRRNKRFIYGLGSAYLALACAFVLYPPYQILASWLVILVGISGLLSSWKLIRSGPRQFIVPMGISILMVVFVMLAYVTSFRHEIDLSLHTSYPGQRLVQGGGVPWYRLIDGFYTFRLQNLSSAQLIADLYPNESEGGSFIFLSFFLIPAFMVSYIQSSAASRRSQRLLFMLTMYIIVVGLWMIVGLPTWLARILMLASVPAIRSLYGLGLANGIWLVLFVHLVQTRKILISRTMTLVTSGIALFCLMGVSSYMVTNHLQFSGGVTLAMMILLIGIAVTVSVLRGKHWGLWLLVLYSFFSIYRINPLYQGFEVIEKSILTSVIGEVEQRFGSGGWVVYDNVVLGNYLVAAGVESYSGNWSYPHHSVMSVFDPDKKDWDTYNRFAHVQYADRVDDDIGIEKNAEAVFTIHINPCSDAFETLGVRYFVSTATFADRPCLKELIKIPFPIETVSIYGRI